MTWDWYDEWDYYEYIYDVDYSHTSIIFKIDKNWWTLYADDVTTEQSEMVAESNSFEEAKAKAVGYAMWIEAMYIKIVNDFNL